MTATAIASFGKLPKRPVSPPGWPGASACGRDRRACGRCRFHQSALPRHAQSFRHSARQRLYRDRRCRHVDGHHLRQHRYFRRRAHRRAGDDQRLARRRGRADHRDLARAARHWGRSDGGAGCGHRLSEDPGDRRHARHAVDPQRRPHQRDRREMDHRPAAKLPPRRPLPVRRANARRHHGARDGAGGALDAQFAHWPCDLRHRRQS